MANPSRLASERGLTPTSGARPSIPKFNYSYQKGSVFSKSRRFSSWVRVTSRTPWAAWSEMAYQGTTIYTQSQLFLLWAVHFWRDGSFSGRRWTWVRVTSKTPWAAWSEMETPSRLASERPTYTGIRTTSI